MTKLLLILSVLFFAAMPTMAEDFYIAQAAAGLNDGSSCANAHAYTFFNTGANWDTNVNTTNGKIGPGDTVHLCGTVTTFNGTTYDYLGFLQSGTAGNLITLKWETGAVFSVPSCGASQCILMSPFPSRSYIALDGGTNGIIQSTDNGTVLGHQDTSPFVWDGNNGCTGCEIKNLTFANAYVHTSTADNSGALAVNFQSTNISIHNNICHDASNCFVVSPKVGANTLIDMHNNVCYNVSHCLTAGNGTNVATIDLVTIHDNEHYDTSNWDTVANTFHHDGLQLFGGGTGNLTITDVEIYNNYFHGNWGANATGQIFVQWITSSIVHVFNNTAILGAGTTQENTGSIFVCGNGTGCASTTGIVIANNTMVGLGFGAGLNFGHPNAVVENNIVQNYTTLVNVDSTGTYATFDHNSYSQGDATLRFKFNATYSATLAAWQASQSAEANSQYVAGNLLDSVGRPTAGSPAIQPFGANLTALGILGLDSDRLGAARPAVAAWDAGALDFLAYSGFQGNGGISGNAGVK